MKQYRALALLLPALAFAVIAGPLGNPAHAQSSGKEVDIEADRMQVLENQNRAIFTGGVNATRGGVRLNCDKLVVTYVKKKKADGSSKTEVTFLDATGNVVIITPKQKINGKWAKMNIANNTLVVGGSVIVHQGPSIIRGKQLTVDLNTNESQISGGRVKGSFSASD